MRVLALTVGVITGRLTIQPCRPPTSTVPGGPAAELDGAKTPRA